MIKLVIGLIRLLPVLAVFVAGAVIYQSAPFRHASQHTQAKDMAYLAVGWLVVQVLAHAVTASAWNKRNGPQSGSQPRRGGQRRQRPPGYSYPWQGR